MKREKITQITDQHLLNRIAFFEKKLSEKPDEQFYIGDSDYAEQSVEQENRHNNELARRIKNHISYMKKEAKTRRLL